MARATKTPPKRAGSAKAARPANSGESPASLVGRVVTCSEAFRSGRWVVTEDSGGDLVGIGRPQANLFTRVSRQTLTLEPK